MEGIGRTGSGAHPCPDRAPVPSSPVSWRWRLVRAAGLAALLVGAALPRLHGLGRGLWTAEAWVANSALADRWADVFHYDAWLQTTPPLFLVLVRATAGALGSSDVVLRAVPFALGVLSVALAAGLARSAFRPPFAMLCAAMVALSPAAIAYSKELKQYTGDLASTALNLFVLSIYLKHRDVRRFAWVLAAFAFAVLLSYTAVVIAPVIAWVLWSTEPAPGDRSPAGPPRRPSRIARSAAFALEVLAIGAAEYVLLIRPNDGPQLEAYWKAGYPEWNGPVLHLVDFYARHFLALGGQLLVPPLHSRGALAVAALLGGGVLALCALAAIRRRERRPLVAMAFGPVATLAVLNALRLHPVGPPRLVLFLLPCVALAVALALEEAWGAFLEPALPAVAGRRALAALGILSAAAVLGGGLVRRWDPWHEEDVESALRYLEANARAGDVVYVHASVLEPAKLYLRVLRWPDLPVLLGRAGFPCCTRDPEDGTRRNGMAAAAREVGMLSRVRTPGSLWLLFTGRGEHWEYLQRNDEELFTASLRGGGWRSAGVVAFPQAVLHRLVRGPPVLAPPPTTQPAADGGNHRHAHRSERRDLPVQ